MRSKWFESKHKAVKLRQQGASLREVEKLLKIPRSTLSGWFKNVELTSEQKVRLRNNWLGNLSKARKNAVIWHKQQRIVRLLEAESQAKHLLSSLNYKDKALQELALAMLYLGEGAKGKNGTCMGSSDPLILRFFIKYLINQGIDISKIKCALHLRADQNPEKLKQYWSQELNIPYLNFTLPSIDLRSKGKTTYSHYNGVCVITCGNIALQRRLIFLSRKFCEKVIIESKGG